MSGSTIFTAFRALLTGLSLVDDPDGTRLDDEALSRFTDESALDFEEATRGARAGANIQNVNQVMRVRRGFVVTADRDTSMKAWIAAQEAIIAVFLAPSNFPSGLRKIEYIGGRKIEKTAEVWIAEVDFQIEYQVSVNA